MILFLFGVSVTFNIIFLIFAYLYFKTDSKYNEFFEFKFNRKDFDR